MKVTSRNLNPACIQSPVVPDRGVLHLESTPPEFLKGYFNSYLGGTLRTENSRESHSGPSGTGERVGRELWGQALWGL